MGAHHYLVVSDLHLCDVEDHPDGWKRHKSSDWVFDDELDALVARFEARLAPGDRFTYVLNGDIFDFDLVTALPSTPPWPVRRLERLYGLDPSEPKSVWKLERILDDHPGFVATLGRLVAHGHDVVVTVGNHDRELWFEAVTEVLRTRVLAVAGPVQGDAPRGSVRVEPWFFHVQGEIFIEHGHQYDYYSSFRYNLEPIVQRHGETQIALSTGNLSNRFLLSNIGFFNPHATDFILSGLGYIRHWFRHYAFTRRMLILTWLLGSLRALLVLLATRARIERNPPRDYDRHIRAAAQRYGLALETARALHGLGRAPITSRFHKIVREFWIDRLLLALGMTGGTIALALSGAALWVKLIVPLLAFPLTWFIYDWFAGTGNALTTEYRSHIYARRVARLLPVRAIVFGHTHLAMTQPLGEDVTFANSGTWAPTWVVAAGAKPHERGAIVPVPGLRNFVWVHLPEPEREDGECHVSVGSWMPLTPEPLRARG